MLGSISYNTAYSDIPKRYINSGFNYFNIILHIEYNNHYYKLLSVIRQGIDLI